MTKTKIRNNPKLKERRRTLRRRATRAEEVLWECLRGKQLGFKFRRQFSIGGYIMDFYCPEKKLGIEADGLIHEEPEQMEYDVKRTKYLQEQGVKLLRFDNGEVIYNTDLVLERIIQELQ